MFAARSSAAEPTRPRLLVTGRQPPRLERTVVEIGGNLFTVIGSDGSARRDLPLPPSPAPDGPGTFRRYEPTFSADGERVIYTRVLWEPPIYPNEIWSAELDGSDDRRLAAGGTPRMSPDGTRIAYVRSPHGVYSDMSESLELMSVRGALPLRRLWRGSPSSLDWAPDGKRLVFTGTSRLGVPPDVYVVRADGSRLRRLTATPKAAETDAAWSPSGKRIAFVREFNRRVDRRTRIAQAIWTLRPDGTRARMIRKPWLGSPEDGKGRVQISWQPLPRP